MGVTGPGRNPSGLPETTATLPDPGTLRAHATPGPAGMMAFTGRDLTYFAAGSVMASTRAPLPSWFTTTMRWRLVSAM